MEAQLAELKKQNAKLLEQQERLLLENRLLQQKVQLLLKRLFGRKSEKLDSNQLELILGNLAAALGPDEDPPPRPPRPRRRRGKRKPRIPEDLPTEDIVIDPAEVKRDPQAYSCIGEEITQELDVILPRYIRRRFIRRKYKSKVDRDQPPIIAPLPARLVEGGYASAGLLTDIVLKKYVDHLPLHRQEQILRSRYGIELSRKTMSDWVEVVAEWLKPIYNYIRQQLQRSGYLQIDETPVRYCRAEAGGSGQGYFWVYHRPGAQVLYEWHTGRGAECLEQTLKDFAGTVQSDGYSAYASFAKDRDGIELAGCWAHVRRKFIDAQEEAPGLTGWFLNQIQNLYCIERQMRYMRAGPDLRESLRAAQSRMILERIHKALKLKLTAHLPKSQMGQALSYTLGHWQQLLRYAEDGRLEIDNNLVENAIRPTALGKKNWLFIGHPQAGQRSAIIYTLLANCRRLGINPQEYLYDVLSRLPSMTNKQVHELLPAKWLAARKKQAA
jgi:transposase